MQNEPDLFDTVNDLGAKFEMTPEEHGHICQQAKMLLPPKGIRTLFNGSQIPLRYP